MPDWVVGVAGAGAVGGHYAARLASAGVSIRLLARGAHLAHLQQRGLVYEPREGGRRLLRLPASDDPAFLADCAIWLLAAKTKVLPALLDALAPYAKGKVVITLQNGVSAPELAARAFPESVIVAGSAFVGAWMPAPGCVRHTAAGGLHFARVRGDPAGKLAWLAGRLAAARVEAGIECDWRAMLWRKMVWNCGFNALTALLDMQAHEVARDAHASQVARRAMEETVQVARALGVRLPQALPEAMLARTRKLEGVRTSMWQDLARGRKTEIEDMNGQVARLAKAQGLDAPVNETLADLVRAREERGKK